MKNFFSKKSVAVTITLVVIALAIVIGAVTAPKAASTTPVSTASSSASDSAAKSWAKKNYAQYETFLHDDAGLFDSSELKDFAKADAQLDVYDARLAAYDERHGLSGTWTSRVLTRLAGPQSMAGRHRLREALQALGLPVR